MMVLHPGIAVHRVFFSRLLNLWNGVRSDVWRVEGERRTPTKASARGWLGMTLLCLCYSHALLAQQDATLLVARTLENEARERKIPEHICFMSRETSTRTGGHEWVEKVVRTGDGEIRRLLTVDGSTLPAAKKSAEDERIKKLIANPDAFRRAGRENSGDESGDQMINTMTRAFLFTFDGKADGGTRVRYRRKPDFKPNGYKERVLHSLEGSVLIKEPENRVAVLEGRISHSVDIGLSLVGKLNENGRVHVVRTPIGDGTWQVSELGVHIGGRVLVLKNISQELNAVCFAFHIIPTHLTIEQAAEMTLPGHLDNDTP